MTDAQVVDVVRDIAWTPKVNSDGVLVRKLNPEGLYAGRPRPRRGDPAGASGGLRQRTADDLGLIKAQYLHLLAVRDLAR